MTAYQRALQRLGCTRWFAWVARQVLTPIDRTLGRRLPTPTTLGTGLPMLLLTTTGRTTGRPRTSPLLYLEDGDRLVVAGTNFGTKHHPGWTYNLAADQRAIVERRAHAPLEVVARRATDEELAAYWPRFVEMWAGYDAYRRRAEHRQVRVYVLEPER